LEMMPLASPSEMFCGVPLSVVFLLQIACRMRVTRCG
jgi:hypothetical protein